MNSAEFTPLHYFSYGMNTSPRVMAHHEVCEPIGPAVLNGYHLTFKLHANIELGGKVIGALWEIDQETLKDLDMQEGYPQYYDRKEVRVICNGKAYNAITYIMTDESAEYATGMSPSRAYIKHIVQGYQEFGIPVDQIKQALRTSQVTVEGIEYESE